MIPFNTTSHNHAPAGPLGVDATQLVDPSPSTTATTTMAGKLLPKRFRNPRKLQETKKKKKQQMKKMKRRMRRRWMIR